MLLLRRGSVALRLDARAALPDSSSLRLIQYSDPAMRRNPTIQGPGVPLRDCYRDGERHTARRTLRGPDPVHIRRGDSVSRALRRAVSKERLAARQPLKDKSGGKAEKHDDNQDTNKSSPRFFFKEFRAAARTGPRAHAGKKRIICGHLPDNPAVALWTSKQFINRDPGAANCQQYAANKENCAGSRRETIAHCFFQQPEAGHGASKSHDDDQCHRNHVKAHSSSHFLDDFRRADLFHKKTTSLAARQSQAQYNGIKVRLTDGQIGRVKEIVGRGWRGLSPASRRHECQHFIDRNLKLFLMADLRLRVG